MTMNDILEELRCSPVPGRRTLENGAILIGNVPHVGPKAWFHTIYAPLSQAGVERIEAIIEKELPPTLKEFFMLANGLNLYSDSLAIFGLRENYARSGDAAIQPYHIEDTDVLERPRDAPASVVFFGSYSWDGSLLYIDPVTERVFRRSRKSSEQLNNWSDFQEFLRLEISRLNNLFDSSGRKIDASLPTVPD